MFFKEKVVQATELRKVEQKAIQEGFLEESFMKKASFGIYKILKGKVKSKKI